MKRAGRWLFNFAAAVSLLGMVAAAVLWIGSYWRYPLETLNWRAYTMRIYVSRGKAVVELVSGPADYHYPPRPMPVHTHSSSDVPLPANLASLHVPHQRFGFGYGDPRPAYLISAENYGLQSVAGLRQLLVTRMEERMEERSSAFSPAVLAKARAELAKARTEAAYAAAIAKVPPTYRDIQFPLWFLVLLSGLLPALWARAWRRRLRDHGEGLCAVCGYDLRATPDRCPECGAIPEAAKGAAA